MIIFFLLATFLIFISLAVMARLWTGSQTVLDKTDDPEWQVLLAKRNEIENDVATPQPTQQALRQEWAQLADALLLRKQTDAASSSAAAGVIRNNAWWLVASSGVLALALYGMIGRWDAQALQRTAAPASPASAISDNAQALPPADGARHPGGSDTIEDRIAKLEQKLQATPGDLEGWVLLSRSRGIQRDFAGASAALEKALALAPGHPDILADLADVSAMTQNKSLAGRPKQLIEQALQSAPDHRKALSLAATAAMQENKPAIAVEYWQRLRATFPPGAPDIAQVDAILAGLGTTTAADAATATVATAPVAATAAPAAAVAGAKITGRVELSAGLIDALKQRPLPATATLFVVAKMPAGPPMPLAVARFPAQLLAEGKAIPFQLDDSLSLRPELKLSSSAQVNLEARIALAGTAAKQPGDLFVAIPNVKMGSTDLRLLIQSVQP